MINIVKKNQAFKAVESYTNTSGSKAAIEIGVKYIYLFLQCIYDL